MNETIPIEQIQEDLLKILKSNGVKMHTKRARTIECSFLQGMMVADKRYMEYPYLVLCLLSGRSVLDGYKSASRKSEKVS
jgi:hypothetical protein